MSVATWVLRSVPDVRHALAGSPNPQVRLSFCGITAPDTAWSFVDEEDHASPPECDRCRRAVEEAGRRGSRGPHRPFR